LDRESTFRNVRFWRKADIFMDIHLERDGTAKKACREYRLVALRQICLSNGLATLLAKKEEPPSSHPDGSQ
jgi:hypothetical protein